ncbi:MAG: gamma-butyrobetaine hydroxylase [Gammaproteobacteria bacterium]|nr:gamma-butyrobetaine hydroxylase [Gammaproteobacteria bacterium]
MIEIKKDSVELTLESNVVYDLPFLWLRDNCQCDECRITETEEKQFLLHTVPSDIRPKSVEEKNDNLIIHWPDSHKSIIPIKKILRSSSQRYPKKESWPEDFKPQKYYWNQFLELDSLAIKGLQDFVRYDVIILKNAPDESNSLELLAKRFGPIHETLFERIHNVSVTGQVYNVAHTSKGLPPHNDFASYLYQPNVQALHMLVNECEGGESVIVDGWEAAKDLKNKNPDFFEILSNFDVPFREFDDNNETYAEAPLIRCSPSGEIESFRFSNQLMQMINPIKKNVKKFYDAYHKLSEMMHSSKYRSKFRLNSGEVLIVASLRVLHARESFIPNGKRHLQDAYFFYDNAANNIVRLSKH